MKIKTTELTGRALDFAASMADGLDEEDVDKFADYWEYEPENFRYSSCWELTGPIIERECIQLVPGKTRWFANNGTTGETPLIAAMRCFVREKLGEEVDVPEELT